MDGLPNKAQLDALVAERVADKGAADRRVEALSEANEQLRLKLLEFHEQNNKNVGFAEHQARVYEFLFKRHMCL